MPKLAEAPKKTETIEEEARRLRDQIFGEQKDPNNWEHCKQHWINDIEWLRKNAARVK